MRQDVQPLFTGIGRYDGIVILKQIGNRLKNVLLIINDKDDGFALMVLGEDFPKGRTQMHEWTAPPPSLSDKITYSMCSGKCD